MCGSSRTPRRVVPVLFNWTPSLPYHVVLVDPGSRYGALARGLKRGETMIVFAFDGEAAEKAVPRPACGQPFFKIALLRAGRATP